MKSKRFKKLPENTSDLPSEIIEKLLPVVKKNCTTKFDESLDISFQINNKQKKSEINIRTVVNLPGGTGKKVKVLALVTPDKETEAKEAGADFIGLDEYLKKIKDGWTDIDIIVTMPSIMGKLGPLGKILGPRGLMPNPKTGTVTMNVKKAISDIKGGKIDFKVDKTGIVHASVGKASFSADKIFENADELLKTILKIKPSTSKGTYIKSIFMSTTMSPGISIDTKL
jgi:large subunit ribosomal protein L1